jgi:hypothetical protein
MNCLHNLESNTITEYKTKDENLVIFEFYKKKLETPHQHFTMEKELKPQNSYFRNYSA